MQKLSRQLQNYYITTIVFSWIIWIPLALVQVNVKEFPWLVIISIGGASPSLIGLIFGFKQKMFSKKTFFEMHKVTYKEIKGIVFAALTIIGAFLLSLLVDYFLFRNKANTNNIAKLFQTPIGIIITIATFIYSGPLSEEYGWRGYTVTLLNKEHSLLSIGIITGIIWSIWHYPLFFLNGQYKIDNYILHLIYHLIKHVSLSIIITYFFLVFNYCIWVALTVHMLSNLLFNMFYPIGTTLNIIHLLVLMVISFVLISISKEKRNKTG
jgi:membrane protease YdiL (CAAX protease family)